MCTPNRQPAGVPVGGQFAATNQPPAQVTLDSDAIASRAATIDALTTQGRELGRKIVMLSVGHVADLVRSRHSEASLLQLDRDDSDSGYFWDGVAILDASGIEVGNWNEPHGSERSLYEEDEGSALSNLDPQADYEFVDYNEEHACWVLVLALAQQAAAQAEQD